jgi:hypothetical protein
MRAVSRRRPAAAGALLLSAASLAIVVTAAPATASLRFSATASAAGVRVLNSSPSFPLTTTPVDATVPSAQSQISTLQGNSAFAAFPSPGADAAALPGLVSGLLAGEVPFPTPSVPGVPTVQYAQCPTKPSADVDAKGFALLADCDDSSARARASSGAAPTSLTDAVPSAGGGYLAATASSTVDAKTGKVIATATAEVTGLSFGGGLIAFGPVISTATVARSPGGQPQRSSDLAVNRITVAGNVVEIGPQGLSVAGSAVTLPGVPSPTDAVNAVLKGAGFTITSLAPTQSADGVVAPGIEIDENTTNPQTGQPVLVKVILGQAAAAASVGGTPDGSLAGTPFGSTSVPAVTSTTEPGLAAGPSSAVEPVGSLAGSTPSGTAALPAAVSGGADTSGPAPAVAPPTAGSEVPAAQLRLADARDAHLKGLTFYPILILAALVVVLGATLARHVGVRLLWSS